MPYTTTIDPGRYSNYTVNVKDFGAQGDGISDDTIPISNAISAVSGGGNIFFPSGTYITGTQLLYSKVHMQGAGFEVTILKLKNGTNADLLKGNANGYGGTFVNVNSANATGSTGGIYNWSVKDMTLDGNKANQTGGPSYCLRQYGYGFLLTGIRVRNGYSGGILSDWNGGGTANPLIDNMETQVANIKIHDCNGIGLEWGGPHDSQFSNMLVFNSANHNIHIGPNASAIIMTNTHSYAPATGVSAVGFLIEAGYGQYSNCLSEGSDTCNIVLLASEISWVGGHIFGAGTYSVTALQIGQQASLTPYSGSANQSAGTTTAVAVGGCLIHSIFSHNEGVNGAINFANDGGNNLIQGCFYQTAGSLVTGTISPSTIVFTSSNGLTADGTTAKGGIFRLPINANQAFLLTDRTNDIFNVNTANKKIELVNNTILHQFSDGSYATSAETWRLDTNGIIRWYSSGTNDNTLKRGAAGVLAINNAFAYGISGSAAVITSSSTISLGSPPVGIVRVNPAANVTGMILAVGTFGGQICTILNESSFTITFAASSSNTADGSTLAIPANAARQFFWDNSTNLWYRNA